MGIFSKSKHRVPKTKLGEGGRDLTSRTDELIKARLVSFIQAYPFVIHKECLCRM